MDRNRRWYGEWGHLLLGICIGLMIVTPALAIPADLPVAMDDETRLYLLIGSGVLLFIALVTRTMRGRERTAEAPRGYGMRFFPSDRPITLE